MRILALSLDTMSLCLILLFLPSVPRQPQLLPSPLPPQRHVHSPFLIINYSRRRELGSKDDERMRDIETPRDGIVK